MKFRFVYFWNLKQNSLQSLAMSSGHCQILSGLQSSNLNSELSLLLGDLASLDRYQRQSTALSTDSIGSSFGSSIGSLSAGGQNTFATRPSLTFDDSLTGLLSQSEAGEDTVFSQQERDSLISHLVGLQGSRDSKLVLTPRQRLALEEETRLRQLSASARPLDETRLRQLSASARPLDETRIRQLSASARPLDETRLRQLSASSRPLDDTRLRQFGGNEEILRSFLGRTRSFIRSCNPL